MKSEMTRFIRFTRGPRCDISDPVSHGECSELKYRSTWLLLLIKGGARGPERPRCDISDPIARCEPQVAYTMVHEVEPRYSYTCYLGGTMVLP